MDASADAVIVGGGPTGLTAAVALTLRGRSATVVDPGEDRSVGSRALVVHAGTLAVLEKAGCAAPILSEAVQLRSMRMNSRRGLLTHSPFDTLPGPYPFAASIHQARTEAALRRRAEELGVRFVTAHATGVDQDEGAAAVALDVGGFLEGRAVVGADGMHSTVREASGITFPDTGSARGDDANMVLADVVASGSVDRVHLNAYPGSGLLVLIPLPNGRLRVLASVRDGERAEDLSAIQELIDSRGPLPRRGSSGRIIVDELEWASRFHFRHHLAEGFRVGRVLLAGDAGHVHSPVGGQGMNLGIRDGWYLAEAIDASLQADEAGERERASALLDAYATNRRAAAQGVIAATGRMHRMLFAPPPVRPLRNLAMRITARTPAPARQALGLSGLLDRGPQLLSRASSPTGV
ncbi:NAD(P)/FAD-dependent oxidoreductase [Sinomonas sp. ASV486]|uniref:FAD-dependent oxidoreductase n=1 Tax=Sinomonas sp. ASV486 TaxID=3051170 RepID=UPI0027DDC112|nr:NAD(P)/FAD-dependent oxidoreductase [Sinomonas sp. ASV486]MDQ4491642.1 NAD(P)/FAD-dependent oxidoreductase [Sinomonas sp. ASV486]